MGAPGRPVGVPNAETIERRRRLVALRNAPATAAAVRRAERMVEQVRRGRGDLNAAIAELRRARDALAEVRGELER